MTRKKKDKSETEQQHVSIGYYAYPTRLGKKSVIRHVILCYHEAVYMLKSLVTQFETLEASVAQLPLAKTIMAECIARLKFNISIIESEKNKLTVLLEEKS